MKEQEPMNEYPEHEKLAMCSELSQEIGDFLVWCEERGWHLAEWEEGRVYEARMMPIRPKMRDVLALYFGIDQDTLKDEKVAMLDAQRALNERVLDGR